MKKTMKRLIVILVIVAAVVTIAAAPRVIAFLWFRHTDLWRYNADFDTYKEEFVLVKDYVLQMKSGESGRFYVTKGYETHPFDLYDDSLGQLMNCPEEVKSAIEELSRNAFFYKDSVFDTIRYNENTVYFCIEGNRYALVYSPTGKPDSYLDTDYSFACKKIEGNWYHLAVRS